MQRDWFAPFPRKFPAAFPGDVVLYSTRDPARASTAALDEVAGGRRYSAWYQTDVASVLKVQVWDAQAGAWITVNGGQTPPTGLAVAANTYTPIDVDRLSGDFQIVVTLNATTTTLKGPDKIRISSAPKGA